MVQKSVKGKKTKRIGKTYRNVRAKSRLKAIARRRMKRVQR